SPRRPAPTPRGPAEGAPPPRRPRVRRVRCASWRYLLLGERQRLLPLEAEFLRSEEHTSELQSPCNIVCRLLLEKKYMILFRPLSTTRWLQRRGLTARSTREFRRRAVDFESAIARIRPTRRHLSLEGLLRHREDA